LCLIGLAAAFAPVPGVRDFLWRLLPIALMDFLREAQGGRRIGPLSGLQPDLMGAKVWILLFSLLPTRIAAATRSCNVLVNNIQISTMVLLQEAS